MQCENSEAHWPTVHTNQYQWGHSVTPPQQHNTGTFVGKQQTGPIVAWVQHRDASPVGANNRRSSYPHAMVSAGCVRWLSRRSKWALEAIALDRRVLPLQHIPARHAHAALGLRRAQNSEDYAEPRTVYDGSAYCNDAGPGTGHAQHVVRREAPANQRSRCRVDSCLHRGDLRRRQLLWRQQAQQRHVEDC